MRHILTSKWSNFGFPLYLLQIFAYFFLIVPLSILVLLPTSSERICGVPSNVSGGTPFDSCYRSASFSLASLIMFFSLLHVIIFLLRLFQSKSKSVLDFFIPITPNLNVYLEALAFATAILFSIMKIVTVTTNGCCEEWTWHFGLFAIMLGWANFIRLFSKLPIIGEHVIVYFDIVWTFLTLTVFALLLVLAATIVLIITFYNTQALQSPFSTFGRGMVAAIAMVTGEFDTAGIFGLSYELMNDTVDDSTQNAIQYPQTANFVWVVLLVFIPILLSNMLIGLAVGDIIEIQKNATLRNLGHQVELANSAESYLHGIIEICRKCRCCRCCHGCSFSLFTEYVIYVFAGEEKGWQTAKEKLLTYKIIREAEIKDIKKQAEQENPVDKRIVEKIDGVKEVALSCERIVKEFKDVYESVILKEGKKFDNVMMRAYNKP